LVARGELPLGFDAARLSAAAASLVRKRVRAASRAWPGLARALGPSFEELFTLYAGEAPLPRVGGPLADGRVFAQWLAAREELPEAGRLQSLAVDVRHALNLDGLVPRRWPAAKTAWLPQSRRLVVAVWLPRLGEHWMSLPLHAVTARRSSKTKSAGMGM
jgi:hypothetical protein